MNFLDITNSFIFKLLLASILGALIGLERDIHGRDAGLRTHLLVSLGSAVFMILSENIAIAYASSSLNTLVRVDPSRIAAQIVTGIGFLGAGTIIKYGMSIRGLTTAACLWLSAGVGMSIGSGYFAIGLTTTGISLVTLVFLNKLEKLYLKDSYRNLKILTEIDTDVNEILDIIKRDYVKIVQFDEEKNYEDKTLQVNLTIKIKHKGFTDSFSYDIIKDLERSKVDLYKLKWIRQ